MPFDVKHLFSAARLRALPTLPVLLIFAVPVAALDCRPGFFPNRGSCERCPAGFHCKQNVSAEYFKPFPNPVATLPVDGASQALAGDFDGDLDMDVLVVGSQERTLALWVNNGIGAFSLGSILDDNVERIQDIALGDFDKDGDLDVLCVSGGDRVAWYENSPGNGTNWQVHIVDTSCDYPLSVALLGSGFAVACYNDGRVMAYHYESNFTFVGTFDENVVDYDARGAYDVVAADFDGDGLPDLAAAAYEAATIAWWPGDGGLGPKKVITNQLPKVSGVLAVDVDADGACDVVAWQYSGGALTWYRNIDGFQAESNVAQPIAGDLLAGISSVAACDLDGDGDMDLASASLLTSEVKLHFYSAESLSFMTEVVHFDASSMLDGTAHVTFGDLDNDGDLDILVSAFYDGTVSWFANTLITPCAEGRICVTGTPTATSNASSPQRFDDPALYPLCPAGYFCPARTPAPMPCPRGTISDAVGTFRFDQCDDIPCTAGKWCPEGTSSSTVRNCSPEGGNYSTVVGARSLAECDIKPCPVGHWCGIGASEPIGCAAGTTSDGVNLTSQDACDYAVCPEGYVCPSGSSATTALPCPAGTASIETNLTVVAQCRDCVAGRYSDSEGSTQCKLCDLGRVSTVERALFCEVCAAGTFAVSGRGDRPNESVTALGSGATSCTPCTPGSFCVGGVATLCAERFFSAIVGASSCEPCRPEYACPAGSTTAEGTGLLQPEQTLTTTVIVAVVLSVMFSAVAALVLVRFLQNRRTKNGTAAQDEVTELQGHNNEDESGTPNEKTTGTSETSAAVNGSASGESDIAFEHLPGIPDGIENLGDPDDSVVKKRFSSEGNIEYPDWNDSSDDDDSEFGTSAEAQAPLTRDSSGLLLLPD